MNHFAKKLAHLLTRNSQATIEEDEVRYGIEVMLGSLLQLVLVLGSAYWLNLFYEASGILLVSA